MRYGRGAFVLHECRPRLRRLPSTAFYRGLFIDAWRERSWPRAAALSGLVLLSQAAVAAGYVSEGAAGLPGLKGFRSGG
jgi:hypothetical protein